MFLAHQWPDSVDLTATSIYVALIVAAPVMGYVCIVLDIRRYLRSMRRALVVVINYFPDLPHWAREATPKCIAAFGLEMPCSEQDLLRSYRAKVKQLHPDRGGDRRRFHKLQQNFEQALAYLRREQR